MDDKNILNKADELLESTSEEKRIRINFSEIKSVESPGFDDDEAAPINIPVKSVEDTVQPEPVEEIADPETIEEINEIIEEAEEVIEEAEDAEPAPEAAAPVEESKSEVQANQNICIIDETSTTVVIEQGPDISADELTAQKASPKLPKEKVKFKPVHIIVLALVALIALWTAIYTVDHTLAANGLSPSIFCKLDENSEDSHIVRYKGLGYTVEYVLDDNGSLISQSCKTVLSSLFNK